MAPHSSTLAWKIPWMEEPGRLQSMGSLRVRHDWVISLSLFIFMHWRRKWQPTPVFLPREVHGQRRLGGYNLWGHKESDTSEQVTHTHTLMSIAHGPVLYFQLEHQHQGEFFKRSRAQLGGLNTASEHRLDITESHYMLLILSFCVVPSEFSHF